MSEKKGFMEIIPLINFDSDAESVNFVEKLCLRRVEPGELSGLIDKLSRDATPYLSLLEADYVLENKIVPPSMKNWYDVILALKLLKAGDLQVLAAFHLDEKNRVSLGVYDDLNRTTLALKPYFLKKDETMELTKLWKRVQGMTSKPYLNFPLRVFTEAYKKGAAYEDRIVDYMIAFESLIFHGLDKSIEPAGEVMGIAVSMLLGIDQEDRTKIKMTLKNAYDVRNAKVHGNVAKLKKLKTKSNVRILSMNVEDYLRHVLRRFIEE